MLQIDDTIISFDIFEKRFVCDLQACKGLCCVEGDSGAPLNYNEIDKLSEILPVIWDDLSNEAKEVINNQGIFYFDQEGEPVTSIVNGRECVFTFTDKEGIWKCAIEKAYNEGKTDFQKPVSCHLYPIRIQKFNVFAAVNYHKWDVCNNACILGEKLKTPLYKFLKNPLIRRFGEDWYSQLEIAATEFEKIKKM
jgi:hypothetical protein